MVAGADHQHSAGRTGKLPSSPGTIAFLLSDDAAYISDATCWSTAVRRGQCDAGSKRRARKCEMALICLALRCCIVFPGPKRNFLLERPLSRAIRGSPRPRSQFSTGDSCVPMLPTTWCMFGRGGSLSLIASRSLSCFRRQAADDRSSRPGDADRILAMRASLRIRRTPMSK